MPDKVRLWMRHEVRETERRAPVVPDDARRLVHSGIAVTVEESPQRVFPVSDYLAAGCAVAPAGSWVTAPQGSYVVGLKELPEEPAALSHRHLYFGHAYKGQQVSRELLRRFAAGGGALLDLEYLVDENGRRLAAFGYWAGYVGAALAVLHLRGRLVAPLQPMSKESLDEALRQSVDGPPRRVLVIGALGRAGRGARDAVQLAGITPTCWDLAETRVLDRAALRDHDVLVNTVLTTRPIDPFLTRADVADPARRLTVVADVSCDVTSECNALPIYDSYTTWPHPARRLWDGPPPLDIIAIDNLPSLLPREASVAFSAELLPALMSLEPTTAAWQPAPAWRRCLGAFQEASRSAGAGAVRAGAERAGPVQAGRVDG